MRVVNGRADRVVVIGAGLAGLAAALHLAGRGRDVVLLDREGVPGGRVGALDSGGYRLDTGPTVLTMPEVLDDTFAAVGQRLADRLDLVKLDPAYRAQFADGSSLDVRTDAGQMMQSVRDFAGPAEARGYARLRAWLDRLFRVEFDRFIAANLDSPWQLVTPQLAKLVAMGGFGRLDSAIGRFLSDERLKRVFSFQSLYAGVSPRDARALYAVIAYMDTIAGVYFPTGGMRAVPAALSAAAADAGVAVLGAREATALEQQGRRVRAVHTHTGERFACDAVVIATELGEAYRLLRRAPRRLVPLRPAPSAVVAHVGVEAGAYSTGAQSLAHHTLSFGAPWHPTFSEIISRGELMSDPSLLVTRPTLTDPGLAPPGRELLSVLAPVPNLARARIDWDEVGPSYADQVLQTVQDRLLPGLTSTIDMRYLRTPADWARHGMVAGTPFSYAHTVAQTGPFRPRNLPRSVDNVALAGAGTTPGVGVPPVLISGRLAADRITGPARTSPVTTVDCGARNQT